MAETISGVSSKPKEPKKERSSRATAAERAAVAELVRAARSRGEDITGPDGLLKSITATVLEAALEEEMTDHLGHPKHQGPPGGAGNIRNGTRPKRVLSDAAGEVTIQVPRDRAGSFDPVIVPKRQRRLGDVDAVAISLGVPPTRSARRGRRQGPDHRGDQRALRRGVRREHLQGHGQPDHRDGPGGDAGVDLPAVAGRVRSGVHRRDQRQGP